MYTQPLFRPTRRPHVWTFQDLMDHLSDLHDIDGVGRQDRMKIRAILDAWSDLYTKADWTCFNKTGGFTTSAPYDTGTIQYVHSTRTVTLTGGTWPSDILYRRIVIGESSYPIETAVSGGTTAVLPERLNPGANVDSGTSYSVIRSEYVLDPEVWAIGPVMAARNEGPHPKFVTDMQAEQQRVSFTEPGTPLYYTVRGAQNILGGVVVDLVPAPSDVREYRYFCKVRPRVLRRWSGGACEYSTGTVTVNASATVTGSGTAWTSDMVGCVMRFTDSTTVLPTGIVGVTDRDNPYTEFRMIKSVPSPTSLVLDEAVEGNYAATKYTIGDPIDITQEMYTALLRLAELKMVFLVPKMDQVSLRNSLWKQADKDARIAENRTVSPDAPALVWTTEMIVRNSTVSDTESGL